MIKKALLSVAVASLFVSAVAQASVDLIAVGSVSGLYEDLATETAGPLENGVPGNRLGGIGSGLAYAGGTTFLALPDRGPNAKAYNSNVDDTVSYIVRFHTFNLSLAPADAGSALPFVLTPMLQATTLLSSPSPLVYGSGNGLGNRIDGSPLGSGAPALNGIDHTHYFTGRSDNFDPNELSTDSRDARLDPESLRVSREGNSVFVSDEYGPYVYQFDRTTGQRIRAFKLPDNLAITNLSPRKDVEIATNTVGRVTNKGMEGLAITPDGTMLVGLMQANVEQDKKGYLRIVTIDIGSGKTHEYAYKLTDGSGVSDIVAVNDHQFLVDERDGAGLADTPLLTDMASAAVVKKLYLIDLAGAVDVTDIGILSAQSAHPVTKNSTPFLDLVAVFNAHGIDSKLIPSKIEGVAFGQDVIIDGVTKHTLFIANDNDFLPMVADPFKLPGDPTRGMIENPNKFFVFAFDDEDLPGYVPQKIRPTGKNPQ